jgi:multiple sugar transport system permease protein
VLDSARSNRALDRADGIDQPPGPSGKKRRRRWNQIWGSAYALPAVALLGIFVAYPLGKVFYYAFTKWNGLGVPEWIGWQNFETILHDPILHGALKNNLIFAISVPIQVFGALVLAYLIHERIPGWRFFRSTFFLPAVYSTVVVGIIVNDVMRDDGAFNSLLRNMGLGFLAQPWLQNTTTALATIIGVVVWANIGYSVLIYLAGMSALDPQLAEAARLDGARFWRVLWGVYVPNLRRVMELVLVINTITAFAYMLTYIYVITNGGPGYSTYSTEFYIYTVGFSGQRLGYAAAISVLLMIIIAIIGAIQIRVITRGRTA